MSGVGGDGFIMVYRKDVDLLEVCNGTGAAPYAATRERYLPDGIPMKGIMSVSVPGLVNSWLDVHEKHGLLSLAECFAPAIDLAANGFPVTHVLSRSMRRRPLLAVPTSRPFRPRRTPLHPGKCAIRKTGSHLPDYRDGGREAFTRAKRTGPRQFRRAGSILSLQG